MVNKPCQRPQRAQHGLSESLDPNDRVRQAALSTAGQATMAATGIVLFPGIALYPGVPAIAIGSMTLAGICKLQGVRGRKGINASGAAA
jgi:hypothetical protein